MQCPLVTSLAALDAQTGRRLTKIEVLVKPSCNGISIMEARVRLRGRGVWLIP